MKKVRVRFAPSPTGPLHIGGVRTALYNYLFAKKHGGDMLLRIEDTDSARFVPGAEDYIIESLNWLGIKIDEGVGVGGSHAPYRQSERKAIYKKYVDQLLEAGLAYIAFDSPAELEAKRTEIANFQYDASTRGQMNNSLTLPAAEVKSRVEAGDNYVVRIKIEPSHDIIVHDLIRGEVKINSSVIDDKVLYKSSDGLPTYHMANIVDDHLMEISHVIRGEEWLPSAPLHVLLYRYLGWEDSMPQFAHLPLLLKPEGNGKLSKRDGDRLGFPVFPLNWTDSKGEQSSGYREAGYFPEAVVNFLALLGWNSGTEQEIFSMDELISIFSLDRVSKSGAKFDFEKAKWFNHQYLLKKKNSQLASAFVKYIKNNHKEVYYKKLNVGISDELSKKIYTKHGTLRVKRITIQKKYNKKIVCDLPLKIDLVKDRSNLIPDLWNQSSYFFRSPVRYDNSVISKKWTLNSPEMMRELVTVLSKIKTFTPRNTELVVNKWINKNSYKKGDVMSAFRISLVGELKGPHMFDIATIIGKQETITRIQRAIKEIKL